MKTPDFDKYFTRTYNIVSSNCFDLIADFYEEQLKIPLREYLPFFNGVRGRNASHKFEKLNNPTDLCLCVYKPYNTRIEAAHVGVYWRGEVFHINESGVQFTPTSVMKLLYKSVRYYEVLR